MACQIFNFPEHLDSYQVRCILQAISYFGDAVRFYLPDNDECDDKDRGEFVSDYLSYACSALLRSGIVVRPSSDSEEIDYNEINEVDYNEI